MTQTEIKEPPNVHINASFQTSYNYGITVEIQIHLRSVHALKEEMHVLYEILRTTSAKDL